MESTPALASEDRDDDGLRRVLGAGHLTLLAVGAIVGGGMSHAVGSALADRILGRAQVSVAVFGDGAVEEGPWHECLNFASLKRLPVVDAEQHLLGMVSRIDLLRTIAEGYPLPEQRPHLGHPVWVVGSRRLAP